jgi:putative aldouronate transport system substrate-binding protein
LEGPDGSRGARQFTGYDFLTFVPVAAEHPEHAVRWINSKLSPDGFLLTVLGREGVHYRVEDGQYFPILPIFQEQMGRGYWFLTGTREDDYSRYWPARLRRIPELNQYFTSNQTKADPYYEPDVTGFAIGVGDYAEVNNRLSQMTQDFAVQVIAGARPLSDIDDFVDEWMASGGDVAKADLNRWYEEEFSDLRTLLD